ncbi:signal peptidase I [bacterium]|nr:signal peptidase I [bacterium]
MFEKYKTKKLLKKLAVRLLQLQWIQKKRRNLPDNIQKKVDANVNMIAALNKTERFPSYDEVKRIHGETEYNFSHFFNKYKQNPVAELVEELWLVVLIALLLKFFVIGSYRVPTGSMVDTINIGDNLFVSMFSYGLTLPFANSQFVEFRDPKRGEIITFIEPGPEKKALVKRVIGLPGDTIFISGKDIYINNKKLEHEKIGKVSYTSSRGEVKNTTQYTETNPEGGRYNVIFNDDFNDAIRSKIESQCPYCARSIKIPPRYYFVMGDNRDDSFDSRFFGMVPRSNVQGKPLFVWFSIQFGSSIFDIVDVRFDRIGHVFK